MLLLPISLPVHLLIFRLLERLYLLLRVHPLPEGSAGLRIWRSTTGGRHCHKWGLHERWISCLG